MKLHELRDNPGAARSKKRIGRGPGSGKGKRIAYPHTGHHRRERRGVAIEVTQDVHPLLS